jgi:nitrogen fixation protein FixH
MHMRFHRIARTLIAIGIAGLPALAFAQAHSHSHAAPNGGQIQKIGSYEGELVVRGTDVILYVVDADEKKVDAAPLSATATILAKGNEQKTVELKPSGDNKLAGKVDFPVEGKFRATISLKTVAGEAGKARYNLDTK